MSRKLPWRFGAKARVVGFWDGLRGRPQTLYFGIDEGVASYLDKSFATYAAFRDSGLDPAEAAAATRAALDSDVR